jgi:hypothetical protein
MLVDAHQLAKNVPINDINLPENNLESWQNIINLLAKIANIPSALIMRAHAH